MPGEEEAQLAAEIARLEAELEKARLESKLQHLQDSVEYYEYSDGSYEEEYIEEEYIEEEVIEEVEYEEEYIEEEEVLENPEQAPARTVYNSLHQAHTNLRKTSAPTYEQVESSPTVSNAVTKDAVPIVAPLIESSKVNSAPKVPSKVRPPPSQGGKPIARELPVEAAKPKRNFPLSRLLQQSNKSVSIGGTSNDVTTTKNVAVAKPSVPKKPTAKPTPDATATTTTTMAVAPKSTSGAGNMKRRIIPNIQPSPVGEETIFEQLLGQKVITNMQLHKCTTNGCMKDQELIGIYFGAKWKSECKRFNPILKKFYCNAVQQHQNLEIIYISADRSLIEFKDCYATMPYLAMPAGTTTLKNELTKAFKIIEMPALVILDDEGSVVTVQGVQKIMELDKMNDTVFAEQVSELIGKWKKTRPIPISEVKKDNTLLHGTIDRGTVYWQN
jgi:Thioredoxin-like